MVAKSYQGLPRSKPFEENGKEYVYVVTKSGLEKKVRWYAEPLGVIDKKALGYEKGYIMAASGAEEELVRLGARYAVPVGWFFPGGSEPNDEKIALKRLNWEETKILYEKYLKK